jgi:hypothetical protein
MNGKKRIRNTTVWLTLAGPSEACNHTSLRPPGQTGLSTLAVCIDNRHRSCNGGIAAAGALSCPCKHVELGPAGAISSSTDDQPLRPLWHTLDPEPAPCHAGDRPMAIPLAVMVSLPGRESGNCPSVDLDTRSLQLHVSRLLIANHLLDRVVGSRGLPDCLWSFYLLRVLGWNIQIFMTRW